MDIVLVGIRVMFRFMVRATIRVRVTERLHTSGSKPLTSGRCSVRVRGQGPDWYQGQQVKYRRIYTDLIGRHKKEHDHSQRRTQSSQVHFKDPTRCLFSASKDNDKDYDKD